MRLKSSNRSPTHDASLAPNASDPVSNQDRHRHIAEAAYFLSARRRAAGKLPDDLLDWLEAERAIDAALGMPRGHVHSPDEIL